MIRVVSLFNPMVRAVAEQLSPMHDIRTAVRTPCVGTQIEIEITVGLRGMVLQSAASPCSSAKLALGLSTDPRFGIALDYCAEAISGR